MILEGLPLLWPGVPDVDVGVHGAGDQELGFKPGPVQIAADTNTSVRPDRVYPLMGAFDLICCYLMTRVCPCREVCASPQPSLHEYRSTRWLLWGQHAHTEIHTGKHTNLHFLYLHDIISVVMILWWIILEVSLTEAAKTWASDLCGFHWTVPTSHLLCRPIFRDGSNGNSRFTRYRKRRLRHDYDDRR